MDWQPISTAPRDGTWFLAWRAGGGSQTVDSMYFVCWSAVYARTHKGRVQAHKIGEGWNLDPAPTHWMPLPQPPTS